jgi:exocyst complex component 4
MRSFITHGIGMLMDTLIMHHTPSIKVMNEHGCARMQLNIFVLQQNLKNIEPDASLTRSINFFDLFTTGPDAIIARARDHDGQEIRALGLGYDELKQLIELWYSNDLVGERREAALQAKKGLDEHLQQLSELMQHADR